MLREGQQRTEGTVEAWRTAATNTELAQGVQRALLHALILGETRKVGAGEVEDDLVGVAGESNSCAGRSLDDRQLGKQVSVRGGDGLSGDERVWCPICYELVDFL